jgi:NADH-quinone oxidoreductase subunit E
MPERDSYALPDIEVLYSFYMTNSLHNAKNEIDATVSRFGDERDNLILILHALQNAHGYVPRESALVLSEKLNIPLARIYEVLTFYHYFRTDPAKEHTVVVCHGTSCWLNGSQRVLDEVREYATKHGNTRVEQVRCVGCCALAPLAFVDTQIYTHLAGDKTSDMLNAIEEPKEDR